jgi:hypothetical protein
MNVGHTLVTARAPYFAQILRMQGKLSQELLDEALRRQAFENRYLGQILCEIAPLCATDIERALAIQERYRLH